MAAIFRFFPEEWGGGCVCALTQNKRYRHDDWQPGQESNTTQGSAAGVDSAIVCCGCSVRLGTHNAKSCLLQNAQEDDWNLSSLRWGQRRGHTCVLLDSQANQARTV